MRFKNGLIAVAFWSAMLAGAVRLNAQQTPPARLPPATGAPGPPASGVRRPGGLVPGQQRPPGDPAQIARGKILYGVGCTACHGIDLRGGDIGGPNLLRSPVALSDRDGELIVPIILGSRVDTGMPAIPMSPEDGKAVAAYVRSVVATIGRQGMPPSIGKPPPSVLVGDAAAGRAYFAAKCSACHSATGDLQGLGTRVSDPKMLQNTWIAGGGRPGRGVPMPSTTARAVTATVTLPSGETLAGRLIRIDDFSITIALADGTQRTFRRDGEVPKVDLRDPMKSHRDLLAVYTDKDVHDVTAYLVTLK